MNQPLQPTQQRIEALDIMRGFALCGIIFANLMSFTGFYSLSLAQIELLPVLDRSVLFAIDFLVEGKFYSVFAMLLGAGFVLQYQRFKQKNQAFTSFWIRRMLVLMMIGLCHMYFIWHGDILTLYSLLGLCLLGFINLPNKRLLPVIVLLLFAPLLMHFILSLTAKHEFWRLLSNIVVTLKQQFGYQDATLLQLRTSSAAGDVLFSNVISAIPRPMSYVKTGRPFQVLGQFLLGIYLVRLYLDTKAPLAPPSKKAILALLGAGIVLNLIYAYIKAITGSPFSIDALGLFQGVVYHVGCTVMALGYMALLYRLCQLNLMPGLKRLAVLGRMSLTMYLMQTTLCVLIFYGYGLALMGQVPFTSIVGFGVGILLLQYWFGRIWLERFGQGPMERLWRWLGYV